MNTKIAILMVAIVGISGIVGTAAFTSGEVTRQASVQVAGDDVAVTGLAPGNSDIVRYDANNELQIDFGSVGGDGVNRNSTYEIGDTGAANETYAFNVTNNDNSDHTYTFDYGFDSGAGSTGNVTFLLYDDTGAKQGEASPSSSGSFTLTSSEVGYVVIQLDAVDADLSGTMTITVS